jgi:hypothetical protein
MLPVRLLSWLAEPFPNRPPLNVSNLRFEVKARVRRVLAKTCMSETDPRRSQPCRCLLTRSNHMQDLRETIKDRKEGAFPSAFSFSFVYCLILYDV